MARDPVRAGIPMRFDLVSWQAGALAILSGISLPATQVQAAQVPIPCVASACGPTGPTNWLGAGNASLATSGSQMTVTQTSQSALLNWSSFNIGAGSTVTFAQPGTSSLAINRIFQANPAQIFGSLKSNGVIYLLNQNGILFGA